MSIFQIAIILIVIGFLLWVVNKVIPMEDTIRKIFNAVVILAVVIWICVKFLHLADIGPQI